MHQQSVLSCFGAGVSSGCVIDIGSQKTSVCCVKDGVILKPTRQIVPFGGDDIDSFLL